MQKKNKPDRDLRGRKPQVLNLNKNVISVSAGRGWKQSTLIKISSDINDQWAGYLLTCIKSTNQYYKYIKKALINITDI